MAEIFNFKITTGAEMYMNCQGTSPISEDTQAMQSLYQTYTTAEKVLKRLNTAKTQGKFRFSKKEKSAAGAEEHLIKGFMK